MENEIEEFMSLARSALSSEIRFKIRTAKIRELSDGDVFIHEQRLYIAESNICERITAIEINTHFSSEEWEWQFDTIEKDSNCTVIGYISENYIQELLYHSKDYRNQIRGH